MFFIKHRHLFYIALLHLLIPGKRIGQHETFCRFKTYLIGFLMQRMKCL